MIPFGSQRANGQDLATHLMNEHDNEIVQLLYNEGNIADDLHGVFAEWKLQADTLTKAKNYIYSLSLNPDPKQPPLTIEQVVEYFDNVELSIGLVGQPRTIVEHVKDERIHYHAAWSRIDVMNERAIQISFDREKLMMMTKQYARDHGITLPDGYYKKFEKIQEKDKDYNLGEKYQFETIGISKEERSELITELWHARDTPESFLRSLEHHGYVLTSGRRPYVLVDMYGKLNSLPKLIADGDVRTKQIREFLGEDRELPDVEQAQAAAKELIKTLVAHKKSESQAERIEMLERNQSDRRREVELKKADLAFKQKTDCQAFEGKQRHERNRLRSDHFKQKQQIQQERNAKNPTGLAGFLAKVSGVEKIREALHKRQDRQRLRQYQETKQSIEQQQAEKAEIHQRAQEMKALDLERKFRALEASDKRELQSLHKTFELEQNKQVRKAYAHMPSVNLTLTPRGRPAMVLQAKRRHTSEVAKEVVRERHAEQGQKEVRPYGDFNEATRSHSSHMNAGEYKRPTIKKDKRKDKGRER